MWYHDYANKHGFSINTYTEQQVILALEHNKQKYGARYCPCRQEHTCNTVCPCKEFRDTKYCKCNLFV